MMVVSVNPIKHIPKITFSGINSSTSNNVDAEQLNPETETRSKIPEMEPEFLEAKSKIPENKLTNLESASVIPPVPNGLPIAPDGIIAKTAVAYVNLSEGIKGTIRGLAYGILSGLLVAYTSTIFNVIRKPMNFSEIFHPKNAGTVGKILAFVVGGLVLAGNVVLAHFRANQREAKVDDTLRGYDA